MLNKTVNQLFYFNIKQYIEIKWFSIKIYKNDILQCFCFFFIIWTAIWIRFPIICSDNFCCYSFFFLQMVNRKQPIGYPILGLIYYSTTHILFFFIVMIFYLLSIFLETYLLFILWNDNVYHYIFISGCTKVFKFNVEMYD